MSAAEKIHDNLPSFFFGLWNHCPEDAVIAWGARGIADRGMGFSLLPDRQTMVGPDVLREPFSRLVLNNNALKKANECAKRLREGWNPHKELEREEFVRYYWERFNEMEETRGKGFEDALFEAQNNQFMSDDKPLLRGTFDRLIRSPNDLHEALEIEKERKELYYKRLEERDAYEEDHPPSPPRPPAKCESEEEECGAEFKKIGKDEYSNCYLDFDCWICDDCGEAHSFDWPEDEDNPNPGSSVQRAFESLISHVPPRMFSDKAETFTLFDDHHLKIMGNTNGSYGYVYVIAFPNHQVIDFKAIKPGSEHPGFDNENDVTLAAPEDVFWSGKNPPPMPGEEVNVTCNGIGKALVFGHMVMHNYLTLNVLPLEPPKFYLENVKRHGTSMLTNVMGSEIE